VHMAVGGRVAAAVVVVVLSGVVSACGSAVPSSPASAPASSGAASGPPPSRRPNDIPQPPSSTVTLGGVGSTLPAPLLQAWLDRFTATYPNVSITYDPSGSAAAIDGIAKSTAAFGATDAALTDAEQASVNTKVLHIPVALGGIGVAVNLPEVPSLQLDAATLASIFLGRIARWSDPAIAALNAGVTLPDQPITVVHRSDDAGATAAFTRYLDASSPAWHAGPGVGRTITWPAGSGAAGDDGVTAAVKATPGAIGYAASPFTAAAGLRTVGLRNPAGNFVRPTPLGIGAAGETSVAGMPADLRTGPVVNAPGVNAYPIVVYAYLVVRADQADRTTGEALVALLSWCLTSGQADAAQQGYGALPGGVQARALAALHGVTSGGAAIWP